MRSGLPYFHATEEEEVKNLTFVGSGKDNPRMVPTQDNPNLAFLGNQGSAHGLVTLEPES